MEEKKEDFQVINDTFIVPGSANGTYGFYQPRESTIFKPNDTIEYYVELARMNQTRILYNGSNNGKYLTNVFGALIITDEAGNIKASPSYSKGFGPFNVKYTDSWVYNNSYVFGFDPVFPPLETRNYIMNLTILIICLQRMYMSLKMLF